MTGELKRRHFLKSISIAAVSYPTLSCSRGSYENGLWKDFTEEEEKIIAQSEMAQQINKWAKRKYSCAESIYYCALEYLGQPLEYGSAAMGFGGGMGKDSLCGFLTGGFMAIGAASQMLHQKHSDAYKYNRKLSNQFWEWFEEHGPVMCDDLVKHYSGEQYDIMGMRVAAYVENLISPAKKMPHTGD
jgi:C_GCAxxG_C_C family probable redox protein